MTPRFNMGWTAEVQRLGGFIASSFEEIGSQCEAEGS